VEGIDALIEGGVPRGAAILVTGEPGAGKSVLAMQFILAGIREGEPGVYATADHPNKVLEAASALGWDLRGAVEDGYARVVRIEDLALLAPGAAVTAAHAAAASIAAAVAEVQAERVALDPPVRASMAVGADEAQFVTTLVRATLEQTLCTTLVTAERTVGAPGLTRLGVEQQVVDGIIELGFATHEGRRRRVLHVRSMYGTRTDLDDHLFAILPGRGLLVGES
jgi:circadian clock protein KaiC